jgi:hypothetical protein
MASKKRKKNPRKNAATAAAPKRRRRGNPVAVVARRRRKHNPTPAGMGRTALGYGTSLLVGGLLGALSAGADKMLDPELVASPWKRGAIDIAGGGAVGLLGAFLKMPAVAHAGVAAGGALGAFRMVQGAGAAADNIKRAQAVIDYQTKKELPAPVSAPGFRQLGGYRPRMLPAGVSGLGGLAAEYPVHARALP